MASNPRLVARLKLLNILSRETLERLSQHERPHTQTKRELIIMAATERWNLENVRDEVDRIFRRT